MKLATMNWNPTDRQLRQFGGISLIALPLLGWIWSSWHPQVVLVLAGIGVSLAIIGMVYPKALKPLFLGLTIAAVPIGMVLGELAMLLIFFGIFFPIGMIFRLLKRDRLKLKFEPEAESYWSLKKQPNGPASYYRQS